MSHCSPALALYEWSLYHCPMDYKSNRNVVHSCKYHVVWRPKYRRRVLVEGIDERLRVILREVAVETRSEILEMEVMPDPLDQFLLRQHGWGSAADYGQAVH